MEGKGKGVLLYYGPTAKSKGMKKCGVAMDINQGKHNGTVNGRQYFDCTPGHGILTDVANCTMLDGGDAQPKSAPKKVVKKTVPKKAAAPAATGAAEVSLFQSFHQPKKHKGRRKKERGW